MSEILINFVHPSFESSRIHRALLECIGEDSRITVNDLYEIYPDLQVDPKREQGLIENHAELVFQFPIRWYSSPALLKEWIDVVFQHNWAYGHEATALRGKKVRLAVSTGSPAEDYAVRGIHGFSLDEFLRPITQTFEHCGMMVGAPFYLHGAFRIDSTELSTAASNYQSWLLEK